ncbi:hypothetical protein ACJRO7_026440 [Eucalyptus globulus]|uniref:Uncharacterized protein n=1 Tax=Eucalyptus globulus TaxID=34317 RepID=A0ABD3JMS5_EUCGL
MGFVVASLIFTVIGILASLCTRVLCNREPSSLVGSNCLRYLKVTLYGSILTYTWEVFWIREIGPQSTHFKYYFDIQKLH